MKLHWSALSSFLCLQFILVTEMPHARAQFGLPDSDGDGIEDVFEVYGYVNNGVTVNYPALGANPFRKDIFIEVDVMQGITLPAGALQNVVTSFANSPTLNPNGSTGINMYIDASGAVPFSLEIDFDNQFGNLGHRIKPAIDVNGSGRKVVCWQDDKDRNGYYQIYGRRFGTNGLPLAAERTMNEVADGQQLNPDVAQNENGDFVVVWQDDRDGNGYYQIYARVFDVSGTPLTGDVKVNQVNDGQQLLPKVGMDDSGNWIAIWEDDRDGNGFYEIFARRFSRTGTPLTNETKVNPISDGQQKYIDIATAGDGSSVVVWQDDRDGNGYYQIYARRIQPNGAVLGNEININQVSEGQQLSPSVSINDADNFVVCWEDDRDGNNYFEIYARRFNGNGTANGAEIRVNQTSSGQQTSPKIGVNNGGIFAVSWEDDRNKNGYYQIYSRIFDSAGTPTTGDILVNTVSIDQQQNPAIGIATNGSFSVVYQDDRNENNIWSLYMRTFDRNGAGLTGDIEVHENPQGFENLKSRYFTRARHKHFHYCIIANSRVNTGSSGIGDLPGTDFIVSLGLTPNLTNLDGTFMHELGHNVNLRHGGNENKNRKPNYLSVMNYRYQFWGADNNCDARSGSSNPEDLNYSQGQKFGLNENSLNERIGICDGEIVINPVSAGQQIRPAIDASDDGKFVAVWQDDRDQNDYYQIFARPYNNAGVARTNEVLVNSVSSGQQILPGVGMANDGSFTVTWQDDRDGNGYFEIYAQRHLVNGNRNGAEIRVNTESSGNQRNPDIGMASDGSFVIVWEDDRDENGYYEIFGRLFSPGGAPLTGDLKMNVVSDKQQLKPRVDMADNHAFVVVWEDDRDGNGYYELFARRFTGAGAGVGSEIRVNSVSSGQQINPDIGVSSSQEFVITWEDDQDKNGFFEILCRRFSANGSPNGTEIKVNQESDGQQRHPRIAANDAFSFAVTWQDDRDANGYYQVFARPFSSTGAPTASEFVVNQTSDGQQTLPAVAIDANSLLYTIWQDDRDGNGFYQIMGLRNDANGNERDRVPIDWDGDGNSNETSVKADINGDGERNILRDYNDWSNVRLDVFYSTITSI